MEVHFLAVTGLKEAEVTGGINSHYRSDRWPLAMFHLTLRAANLILKLPARVLESVVDGKCQVGMSLVVRGSSFHVHLAAVRKRETNIDLVKSAPAVMLTRPLQDDSARRHTTPPLLKFGNTLLDDS